MATQQWGNMFPLADVTVLEVTTSDHLPLMLQLHKKDGERDLMEKIMSYSLKLEEWGGGLIREMKVQIELFSSVKDSMRLSPRIKFPVISDIQKEILVRPVADEEVKAAGFAMHSDKSPAYDRSEWSFIEEMLQRFEFPTLWVDRVMNCVKSISYSFLRDGDVFGEIIPQRGVRQGDPISPFMYIICAEGLSGMIRVHEECGLLHGRKIANKAPSISHLLFAYDCYFFLKAKKSEAITLKSALQRYEVLSGQIINYEKSEVVFSPNTNEEDRMEVCESLGVRQVQKPGKYLGMPMNVGSSKTEVFGFLVNRVQQRLKGWYGNDVSRAGKITLLSSAAQTIPSFWMNLFLIPVTICEEVERKMNAFLWGSGGGSKGKSKSDHIFWPKFGPRQLSIPTGWRLLKETNPLDSTVMKAKYYPKTSLLDATAGANPSFVWRSIMESMEVLKAGTRRRIGNGKDTGVWDVPWLPDMINGCITTPRYEHLHEISVNNLMQEGGNQWDKDIVYDLFQSGDADLIKQIPLPIQDKNDSWLWILDEKGEYTVKSGYRWLQGEFEDVNRCYWTKLRALNLLGKVTNFLWRVCRSCLPTASALILKRISIDIMCPWCHSKAETDGHVLFSCDFARTVWAIAGMGQVLQCSSYESAGIIIRRAFDTFSKEQCGLLGMVCWSLWRRRNKWVWIKANGSAFGVVSAAKHLLSDWRQAQMMSKGEEHVTATRHWEKPNAGCGAVVRDAQGQFRAAMNKKVAGKWSPREAEAIGFKEALSWIVNLRCENCVFETDSKTLVQACKGASGDPLFGR
ncbi:uncharacterized protein LOC141692144 [Apium graveolens]|uniref:uncharacterized protein LOC141692144 n=1 Tax=Apium graveolens TaxID=4045 RepID=UPI003D7ACFE8